METIPRTSPVVIKPDIRRFGTYDFGDGPKIHAVFVYSNLNYIYDMDTKEYLGVLIGKKGSQYLNKVLFPDPKFLLP